MSSVSGSSEHDNNTDDEEWNDKSERSGKVGPRCCGNEVTKRSRDKNESMLDVLGKDAICPEKYAKGIIAPDRLKLLNAGWTVAKVWYVDLLAINRKLYCFDLLYTLIPLISDA